MVMLVFCEPGMFGSYMDFRAAYWAAQADVADFDPDSPGKFAALKPKANLFFHDVWVFDSWSSLSGFLKDTLDFSDLTSVQTRGRKVLWLDYALPPGGTHKLPRRDREEGVA